MSYATWLGGPKAGRVDDIPDHIQQVTYTDHLGIYGPDSLPHPDAPTVICPVVSNEAGRWIIWDGEEYGIWTPVLSQDAHDDLACRRSLEAMQAKRLMAVDCYPQTIRHHWEDRLPLQPRWAIGSVGWRPRS